MRGQDTQGTQTNPEFSPNIARLGHRQEHRLDLKIVSNSRCFWVFFVGNEVKMLRNPLETPKRCWEYVEVGILLVFLLNFTWGNVDIFKN